MSGSTSLRLPIFSGFSVKTPVCSLPPAMLGSADKPLTATFTSGVEGGAVASVVEGACTTASAVEGVDSNGSLVEGDVTLASAFGG